MSDSRAEARRDFEIRPLDVLITLLVLKNRDGWGVEVNGHPETFCSSQHKEEAIDGSLALVRRLIHETYG